jgi:hypothetical protein
MIIEHSNHLFKPLHLLANATNPLLGIALIVGLILLWQHEKNNAGRIFIAAVISIVLIQVIHQVAEVHYNVWGHWGMNFSTHAAMTIVFCVPLALLWKRLWWLFLLIFIAYDVLMILLAFHSLADIVTTTIVILPICLLCHFAAQRRKQLSAQE